MSRRTVLWVFSVVGIVMVVQCVWQVVLLIMRPMEPWNIFMLACLVTGGVLNWRMAKAHYRALRFDEPLGEWWKR